MWPQIPPYIHELIKIEKLLKTDQNVVMQIGYFVFNCTLQNSTHFTIQVPFLTSGRLRHRQESFKQRLGRINQILSAGARKIGTRGGSKRVKSSSR